MQYKHCCVLYRIRACFEAGASFSYHVELQSLMRTRINGQTGTIVPDLLHLMLSDGQCVVDAEVAHVQRIVGSHKKM
jgi:hypothetical protein